ncbi:DUF5686 family protein [Myroides pelagicus]|uniref:DUF5686 family protein n=1 Tax=Myroides pelagicus TaxID=270914 RepID=UPI002DB907DE|nr:DUF5686 family protein [Myroides pelagicus]MEC4115128.1 DUF5686 family protein [Myroides pelagicus]
MQTKRTYIYYLLFLLLCPFLLQAQQVNVLKGIIVNEDNTAIDKTNIFVKNTRFHTQSSVDGQFALNLEQKTKGKLFIQKEGYLNTVLDFNFKKETFFKKAIVLHQLDPNNVFDYQDPQDEYAVFLVNLAKQHFIDHKYTVDFYSKANIQLVGERQTFLGQKRKDLDATLDLNHSDKYVYLGELVSEITYASQDKIKEKVTAQREAGNNKDIFFQTGIDSEFNIYHNQVSNQLKLLSPLAPYASSYYTFKLIKKEQNELGHTLYTISFEPKRNREPIMEGELILTDDGWQITDFYGAMNGENIGLDKVKQLVVIQKYEYNNTLNRYVKTKQNLYIKGKFIVFDYIGQYNAFYTNYAKAEDLSKKDFSTELITYTEDFLNRSSVYWDQNRPTPLSSKEIENFARKSIFTRENTKSILDSIDRRTNNLTLFKFIKGYEYLNSYQNRNYHYRGLLSTFAFNAVQGFNVTTGIDFTKEYEDFRQTKAGTIVNYGTSENKFRFSGYLTHIFNKRNYNTLSLSGGSTILQFNQSDPIKTPINSFASAWFGKNYAKYFQKNYVKITYSQYAFTGIKFDSSLEYAFRSTLRNSMETPPFAPNQSFTSNNPLAPDDFDHEPFIDNSMFKLKLGMNIVFDQKIISYPNQKQYIPLSRYPIIAINLEKGLNASTSNYNYTYLSLSTYFNNNIKNYGNLFVGISAGSFLEKNDISFTDYKHFNGNQTFVGSTPIYNSQFNLLPYYQYSTNKSYIELHMEHDFRGYVINKIPLLNKTRFSFVLGFHMLEVPDRDVYQEFSIGLNNVGFKKFRPFRIDYFTSISPDAPKKHGIVLGIKVLDLIQK